MKKIKESELNEYLLNYQDKCVVKIEFDRGILYNFFIKDAIVKYDRLNGFILIEGEKNNLKINTAMVNRFEINDNELLLDLDNILVRIKKEFYK